MVAASRVATCVSLGSPASRPSSLALTPPSSRARRRRDASMSNMLHRPRCWSRKTAAPRRTGRRRLGRRSPDAWLAHIRDGFRAWRAPSKTVGVREIGDDEGRVWRAPSGYSSCASPGRGREACTTATGSPSGRVSPARSKSGPSGTSSGTGRASGRMTRPQRTTSARRCRCPGGRSCAPSPSVRTRGTSLGPSSGLSRTRLEDDPRRIVLEAIEIDG